MLVSGRMFTGRDAVHAHLMKHEPPVDLRGAVLYHCGPVVVKQRTTGGWQAVTAARARRPASARSRTRPRSLKRYGVRVVIGKGGMGAKTLAGLKESGAVYLNAIGGAAQFYARCIERVDGVSLMEFGTPEAMWHLEVRDFPGDRHDGRARQQPAQGCRRESGEILETLRTAALSLCAVWRGSVASPPRTSAPIASARAGVGVLEVDAHGPPVVRLERFDVAERLRALQHRERVARVRDRRARSRRPP